MYDIMWIVIAALVITVGFYAMMYFIAAVVTKCVSWLLGLLCRDKNKEEQTGGNTVVGSAKNLFEKREKHHAV